MKRVALSQGSYTAQGFIANAQRCVNLYPEKNSEDSQVPFTFYPTPGLKKQGDGAPNKSNFRGLFTTPNQDQLFAAVDNKVYYIDAGNVFTLLGTIESGQNPVSFTSNLSKIVLVNGPSGYTIDVNTHAFSQISDPAFVGSDKTDYLDTFIIFNQKNTPNFYTTLSNQVTPLDATYLASKAGFPDNLQTFQVVHRELWLLGKNSTEVWNNVGGQYFPFQIVPGVFIQQGCVAKYSVATHDLEIFWLSANKNGQGIVLVGREYEAVRISTPAIEYLISTYAKIDDAVGYCYSSRGHVFYVLNFPSADKTLVYDTTTNLWHERSWTDNDGVEHRHRAICHAFAYGKNYVGDWNNGNLYTLENNYYLDDVLPNNSSPIVRRKTFPHSEQGGEKMSYLKFAADIECGEGVNTLDNPYSISLRFSRDRGYSFGNPRVRSIGAGGQAYKQPMWTRFGMSRDGVFELFWDAPVHTALNGAWVDMMGTGN